MIFQLFKPFIKALLHPGRVGCLAVKGHGKLLDLLPHFPVSLFHGRQFHIRSFGLGQKLAHGFLLGFHGFPHLVKIDFALIAESLHQIYGQLVILHQIVYILCQHFYGVVLMLVHLQPFSVPGK